MKMFSFNNICKILPLSAGLLLVGCSDFLDRESDSYINKQTTFSSYERTAQYLTGVYSLLPEGLNRFGSNAMLGDATDDAEFVIESSNIQKFNLGAWNAIDNPDDQWNRFYAGIRKACEFIESADQVNLDSYRLDPQSQIEYNNRLKDIRIWKAEARFLRAYYHFELLKRYGPIPVVTSTLDLNGDYKNTPRPTMKDVVDFITKECDEAANDLELTPWRNVNDALGHATKGAALALKSRTLLYAASPLYVAFGDINEANKPSDAALWKAAADAAKAVIDLNQYQLADNYGDLFKNDFKNKEYIFVRRYTANTNLERSNFPVSFGGEGGTCPSQNLVDDYEMLDGTPFDWNRPARAAQPFVNRDKRLEATILMNMASFKNKKVETFPGGADASS